MNLKAGNTETKNVLKNTFSNEKIRRFLTKYTICPVLILIIIFASIVTDNFFSADNLLNVLRQVATNGIIAIGMTYVILTAGIDISVGSIVGFASIVFAGCFQPSGLVGPVAGIVSVINRIMPHDHVLCIIIASVFVLFLCALLGLINGVGISKGKLPPFIMTMQ